MSDIYNPRITPADDYTDYQNELQANTLPPITATEVFHELGRRCANGMQYTTFPNTITDDEKAKLEDKGYIVTRNYVPTGDRYGQGKLYIGIQVALNQKAAEKAMQMVQETT